MAVEGLSAFYSGADLATDYPEGATSTARIAVAQWGEGFGWGSEAEVEAEIRRSDEIGRVQPFARGGAWLN